jgi:hypothetical protein
MTDEHKQQDLPPKQSAAKFDDKLNRLRSVGSAKVAANGAAQGIH